MLTATNKQKQKQETSKAKQREKFKDTEGLVYQINLIPSSHAQLFKQNLHNAFI